MPWTDDISTLIPEIPPESRYWLIRTEGGVLFDSFIENGLIAVGHPEIDVAALEKLRDQSEATQLSTLRDLVAEADAENQRPGLGARQVRDFAYEMKPGDFAVIPDHGSHRFAIGRVSDGAVRRQRVDVRTGKDNKVAYQGFFKVRSVVWDQQYGRWVDPRVYPLFNNHQAVTNIDEYSSVLNPLLHDVFVENGRYHLILRVRKTRDVGASDLYRTMADLFDLSDELAGDLGEDQRASDLMTRTNVSSPGAVELIGYGLVFCIILGLVTVFLCGGKMKFRLRRKNLEGEAEVTTKGIIQAVSDKLDADARRDVLRSGLTALDAAAPREMRQIVDEAADESDKEEDA